MNEKQHDERDETPSDATEQIPASGARPSEATERISSEPVAPEPTTPQPTTSQPTTPQTTTSGTAAETSPPEQPTSEETAEETAGRADPAAPLGDGSADAGLPHTGGWAGGSGAPPPPPPYGAGPQAGQPQPGPQGGPNAGDRLLQDLRALRRSRTDRVIAGVCGGVARQLGIDPLLVRVVTAVLCIFGAGLVLYAIAWLLLPVDDGSPSIGEQAVGRGGAPSSSSTILLAVGLAIVATLGIGAAFSHWDGPFLLGLAALGLIAWLMVRDRRGEPAIGQAQQATYAPSAHAAAAPTGSRPGYAGTTPAASGPVTLTKEATGAQPTGPAASNPLPTYQPPRYQGPGYQPSPGYPPYQGHQQPPAGPPSGPYGGYQRPVPPPPPPAPRRPKSALFSVTMSLVLVGLGALKLVELSGVDIVPSAYPALALAIIAVALLVGTWVGRSRGLIAVGVIAAIVTGGMSAADQWNDLDGNHVNLRFTPVSVAQLPTKADYDTGTVRYDLTNLDFTGVSHSMKVSMGAGEVVVLVPPDVDVTGTLSMGIGQVDFFGDSRGGFPSDITLTDVGADGVGGGSLNLDLDAGVGRLEVRRG